ncbi:hypothetical protein [Brevibacillus daliensis]|uniref:hypothetical protein n=1 Tax=Brevibacillus daliensis TaxID=2892995 RepID=UPI001E42770E|nr:hypothetical protein [Brevibacillus daliensis]
MIFDLCEYRNNLVSIFGQIKVGVDDSEFSILSPILNKNISIHLTNGEKLSLEIMNIESEKIQSECDDYNFYSLNIHVKLILSNRSEIEEEDPITCAYWMLSNLNMDLAFIDLHFATHEHSFKVYSSSIEYTK